MTNNYIKPPVEVRYKDELNVPAQQPTTLPKQLQIE